MPSVKRQKQIIGKDQWNYSFLSIRNSLFFAFNLHQSLGETNDNFIISTGNMIYSADFHQIDGEFYFKLKNCITTCFDDVQMISISIPI